MNRPWLAHYDYWVPPSLTYPERPLWEILDAAYVDVPDRPATAFLGATLTFRDIKTRSDWFAAALGDLGLSKGDRVGIMLPNCPQYMIAAFAVLRHGAIVVNINPTYTARELLDVANDSGMRIVLTLETLAPLAQSLVGRTAVEQIIITSLAEYSSQPGTPSAVHGALAFASLTTGLGRPPVTRVAIAPDDVAVLQYTGGTTGTPKGAMLTHRSIFANVVQTETFTYRTRTRGEGRYMLVLPYFHIFGFTVGMMKGTWTGALQILFPRFDVEAVIAAVRDFVPTYFPAVPTIWIALLAHPDAANCGLDRVRIMTSGAAPCPPDVLDRFERTFGRSLFEGFGLSEASPVTHSTPLLGLRKQGTIGLPMPDTDIKVVDLVSGTHDLPAGEAGELCIAGPQLMKGYWNQPDATADVLRTHADGRVWLHTGDIATIDDDGYTRIVQRKKDMIIVDGYNVYPGEVESVLLTHPAVRMAAVVGVPDACHGEAVRAFIVRHPGATATAGDITTWCREQLAPYKVPRQVDVRDSLPLSTVGKVLYRVLREELTSQQQDAS
ncbi:MAG TPA: long-chain fatty acid--CoA ligase [Vicinamibacterales bacterium]|nr:long-chain fatty acid--CoA ligase [Vicinamibacterales bacterium]